MLGSGGVVRSIDVSFPKHQAQNDWDFGQKIDESEVRQRVQMAADQDQGEAAIGCIHHHDAAQPLWFGQVGPY